MKPIEQYERSLKETKKYIDRSIEIFHEIKGKAEAEEAEFPKLRDKTISSRLNLERNLLAEELMDRYRTLKNIQL